MQQNIILIACVSENNVIGNKGKMIFHIPEDLAYFKTQTLFHPIIMGRKTFESIGKELDCRHNFIITSNLLSVKQSQTLTTSFSVQSAILSALLLNKERINELNEIFIIGGGEIYRQSINSATKLLITRVHQTVKGDTFFPEIDKNVWELTDCKIGVSKTFKGDFFYETYMLRNENRNTD